LAAVTLEEAPVIKIPSLEEEPAEDPVPLKVMGAVLLEVMAPAVETWMPRFVAPLPLPVPVRLMAPVTVEILLFDPSIRIPQLPIVPAEVPVPFSVIGAIPLVLRLKSFYG
jgi:hypothetical protein